MDWEVSSIEAMIDAIGSCASSSGTPAFMKSFLKLVEFIGAGKVTAFTYHPAHVRCLLSHHFSREAQGGGLVAAYLDGWFREDPIYRRAIAMQEGECSVNRLEDSAPELSATYISMFLSGNGFKTKVSVLVAHSKLRMGLNLYFYGPEDREFIRPLEPVVAGLYRLMARVLGSHYLRWESSSVPLPLALLSERERQVCLGMLAGQKTTIIAAQIGIEPSSVKTYRLRAYQKLGISSRGQLFALCRPSGPDISSPENHPTALDIYGELLEDKERRSCGSALLG